MNYINKINRVYNYIGVIYNDRELAHYDYAQIY